jgi:nitrogen-specific signal transduction histidine kinase
VVLEVAVKILANPIFIRILAAFLSAVTAFVVGVVGIRMLRRGMVEDAELPENSGSEDTLPLHTSAIIQQLKQQKFTIQSEQQAERRRTKTSEQITAAMIANLPCGVLFVAPNGLVRQANAAARQILGFASPLGMSMNELFRDARTLSESGQEIVLAEAFENVLSGRVRGNQFSSSHLTPQREQRALKLTLIPVNTPANEVLGVAAVISDESAMADLQREGVLRAEISAEMALELRTSLASIRECVERMRATGEPQRARDLAADISAEADRLERLVGKFLAGSDRARGAEA